MIRVNSGRVLFMRRGRNVKQLQRKGKKRKGEKEKRHNRVLEVIGGRN